MGKVRQRTLDDIERASGLDESGVLADCGCVVHTWEPTSGSSTPDIDGRLVARRLQSHVAPKTIGKRHGVCNKRWQRVQ